MKRTLFFFVFLFSIHQLDAAALRHYASKRDSSCISDKEKEEMFSGLMTACIRWDFKLFSLIVGYPSYSQIYACYQFSTDRITLLHVAINFSASTEFAEYLVNELHYPLDIPMWNGYTPLHLAAFLGDVKKCELLVSAGASLMVYDMDGLTPYGVAVQHNRKEIIQLYHDKNLSLEERSEIIPEKTEEQLRKIKKRLGCKEESEKKESKQEEELVIKKEESGYPRFVCDQDDQLHFDSLVDVAKIDDSLHEESLYDEIISVDFLKKS